MLVLSIYCIIVFGIKTFHGLIVLTGMADINNIGDYRSAGYHNQWYVNKEENIYNISGLNEEFNGLN